MKHFKINALLSLMILYVLYITTCLLTGCQKDMLVTDTIPVGAVDTPMSSRVIPATQDKSIPVTSFDADLTAKGDLSAYKSMSGTPYKAMVIDPSRISVVNDPVYGATRKTMLMDVRLQDNGGLTENPRAQVQTPMSYVAGQTVFIGLSVRFTQTIWTYFLTFSEIYGAPYHGTSPFRLGIQGSNIIAAANNNNKQTNLWQQPMEKDIWYDFVYAEVLSDDPSKGSVQLWVRKQGEIHFKNAIPLTKLATITAANKTGPNYHKLACYYDLSNTYTDASKKTKVSAVKMYLANHKVGGSFDCVAPALLK